MHSNKEISLMNVKAYDCLKIYTIIVISDARNKCIPLVGLCCFLEHFILEILKLALISSLIATDIYFFM